MHEWEVDLGLDRRSERVHADGWQVTTNGDLLFLNAERGREPFFLRAFATGTWREVSLYA